jgi:YVTN family beta-propeller protein
VTDLNPLILNPMPKQPPNVFGTPVTYTASVQNAINPQFKWFFDDGTETVWSSSPSVTHSLHTPSLFYVGVSAKDDRGVEQSLHLLAARAFALTAAPPVISGQMAVRGGRLWVVNQDNDTVSVFNTPTTRSSPRIAVGVRLLGRLRSRPTATSGSRTSTARTSPCSIHGA